MTIATLLPPAYALLALGMALVVVDLRAQGLRTAVAVRGHMHTFRIVTVAGASMALLGLVGLMIVAAAAIPAEPLLLVAAAPGMVAFWRGARILIPG
jgi:hypothetical protein